MSTDPRLTDSIAAHAKLKLIACRERLQGIPWTHRVDHSFKPDLAATSCGAARLVYLHALAAAPSAYAPRIAWMMPEPHPTNPSQWHMHGLWLVRPGQLWRGWWRDCKEWWGENAGWARIWPLPVGDKAALGGAVDYAAKHHVKTHPLAWWRYETRYELDETGTCRVYAMRVWSKSRKERVVCSGEGQQRPVRAGGFRSGA